jgi:hypothetical protein
MVVLGWFCKRKLLATFRPPASDSRIGKLCAGVARLVIFWRVTRIIFDQASRLRVERCLYVEETIWKRSTI